MLGGLGGVGSRGGLAGVEGGALGSSAARSVLGRSAATSGIPTDIVATADDTFLGRIGGVLAWAPVTHPNITSTWVVRGGDTGVLTGGWSHTFDPTTNQLKVEASVSGTLLTGILVNNSSPTASSAARIKVMVGNGATGDVMHSLQVSGGAAWTYGIDNSAGDQFALTPADGTADATLGTGDVLQITTAGDYMLGGATVDQVKASSGGTVVSKVRNTSNTASSAAQVLAEVAGTSAGNPSMRLSVAGATTWDWVCLNASSDSLDLQADGARVLNVTKAGFVALGAAADAIYQFQVVSAATNLFQAAINTSLTGLAQYSLLAPSGNSLIFSAYGTSRAGNTSYGIALAAHNEIATTGPTLAMAMTAGGTWSVAFGAGVKLSLTSTLLTLADAVNIAFNATTGTKIGTATGQKIAFWNAAPVAQQVLATGGGATVDNVITFLQTVGLCKQS